MKPSLPMNTPSLKPVAASDESEMALTSAPPSGRGASCVEIDQGRCGNAQVAGNRFSKKRSGYGSSLKRGISFHPDFS